MAVDYNKYQKLVLKYSYNGTVWSVKQPAEYMKGEIIEANSYDCGFINPIYRWVDISGEYYCVNQSKYKKQRQQVSNDDGATWSYVIPFVEQAGDLIEENSYDCDYGVTWEPVDNEYICKRAFYPSNYCDAVCPDDTLDYISYELVGTYPIPEIMNGYSGWYIQKPYAGIYLRTDGYLFTWNPDTGEIYYNGFLQNNNQWLILYAERQAAVNWGKVTSGYSMNEYPIDDWFYCRHTISSSTNSKYLHAVYRINIKTGLIDILIDSVTSSPVYDTNKITIKSGTTVNPMWRLGSNDTNQFLIYGTKMYYFYIGSGLNGLVISDLYCNNIQVVNFSQLGFHPGGGAYGVLYHNPQFPTIWYLFDKLYKDSSYDSGKTFGTIYRCDVTTAKMEDFGLWMCDLTQLNTDCETSFVVRGAQLGSGYYMMDDYHRLTIDTPVMALSKGSNSTLTKAVVISDSTIVLSTSNVTPDGICNIFNPVYYVGSSSNSKIIMYKWS